ncbi:hypothetical protein [Nostoc sp. NMS8]|uniref:hypothetical protein n=1 Tax=Nostoc sp. NMS8 TaxID=2815392 RepID=UPI003459AFA9
MKIQHGIEPRYDTFGEIFLNGGRYTLAEQLAAIALQKPYFLYDYLVALSFGEHFFSFCHEVKVQLEALKQQQQSQKTEKAN